MSPPYPVKATSLEHVRMCATKRGVTKSALISEVRCVSERHIPLHEFMMMVNVIRKNRLKGVLSLRPTGQSSSQVNAAMTSWTR